MCVCLSVCLSVRASVRPSVGLSVCLAAEGYHPNKRKVSQGQRDFVTCLQANGT